jgi:hypothetical protein
MATWLASLARPALHGLRSAAAAPRLARCYSDTATAAVVATAFSPSPAAVLVEAKAVVPEVNVSAEPAPSNVSLLQALFDANVHLGHKVQWRMFGVYD